MWNIKCSPCSDTSKRISTCFPTVILFILLRSTLALIEPNATTDKWDYTILNSFADTVSPTCQSAYATSIDCDGILLDLSMDFANALHSSPSNLKKLCTKTCKTSLQDYTRNLGIECNGAGDVSLEGRDQSQRFGHVWLVGQVLEYIYAQSCLIDRYVGRLTISFCSLCCRDPNLFCDLIIHDSHDHFCFSGQNAHVAPDCSDPCSVKYYENTHNFAPASYKRVDGITLVSRSPYWIGQFKKGYKVLRNCKNTLTSDQSSPMQTSVTGTRGVGFQEMAGATSTISSSIGTSTSASETVTAIGHGGLSSSIKVHIRLEALGFLLISLWAFFGALCDVF